MLQILLQYSPIFLLKEIVVFAHACYLRKSLFRRFVHQSICCCFRSKCNARTRTLKFATTGFYVNFSLCSSPQSITICFTLHYLLRNHRKKNMKAFYIQQTKLDCVTAFGWVNVTERAAIRLWGMDYTEPDNAPATRMSNSHERSVQI